MRAVGYDPLHFALCEHRHILLGQLLEQELVTNSASRFTRAAFLGAEHREVHTRGLQQSHHTPGDFLHTAIVGRSAAYPESPRFKAKVVASFAYTDFDPTAQTTISIFPANGGEVTFPLDFSKIK